MGAVGTAALLGLAFVLMLAAPGKLLRSRGAVARGVAAIELCVVASVLVVPGTVSGLLLASLFAAFTLAHARQWRLGLEDCGCFGAELAAAPSAKRAGLLTAVSAAVALAVGLAGARGVVSLASADPSALPAVIAAALIVALVWRWEFSARPGGTDPGTRLVNSSALFLERRLSRRTALIRVAQAGSALAIAPLRYLLYPGTALAVIAPGNCAGGACDDGYTEFCCQINNGLNSCPEGTFAGGWWMCTDYAGRQLCAEQGVRYYVDCNALPERVVDGGCHCGGGSCGNRRVGCNVFRYGQCNTHIAGITAVVCRMILCENPSAIASLHCSASLAVDNAVCGHEAPCLEAPALELVGAGGV